MVDQESFSHLDETGEKRVNTCLKLFVKSVFPGRNNSPCSTLLAANALLENLTVAKRDHLSIHFGLVTYYEFIIKSSDISYVLAINLW